MPPDEPERRSLEDRLNDNDAILKALRHGYLNAIRHHQIHEVPMVFWENEQVIYLTAEEVIERLRGVPWFEELQRERAEERRRRLGQ